MSEERKEELEKEYSSWETGDLLQALIAEDAPYEDIEVSLMEAELRRRNVPLVSKCPVCTLINPTPATICPSCGYNFQEKIDTTAIEPDERICVHCHQVVKKQALSCNHCGYIFDPKLHDEQIQRNKEEHVDKIAKSALKVSLIGVLISFGLVIFAPSAILVLIIATAALSRGSVALTALKELRKEQPDYRIEASIQP